MKQPRITVVVNKEWEADAVMGVLLSRRLLGKLALREYEIVEPRDGRAEPHERPRVRLGWPGVEVAFWCLDDVIPPGTSSSLTDEKRRALERLNALDPMVEADLTVALGTAGSVLADVGAGAVIVGSDVAIRDVSQQDAVISILPGSECLCELMQATEAELNEWAWSRMLPAPRGGGRDPIVHVSTASPLLTVLNCIDKESYDRVEPDIVAACTDRGVRPACVDTTLGLIRTYHTSRFIFIAGITDRVGEFRHDAMTRAWAQRYVASFNAALVLSWILGKMSNADGLVGMLAG